MTDLIKIDDEVISSDDFVKLLRFTGRYDELMEDIIKDKLTIHAARKQGIEVSPEEIQDRADQVRRVRGLHRAVYSQMPARKLCAGLPQSAFTPPEVQCQHGK